MQEQEHTTIEINKPPMSHGGVWLLRSFELFSQKPAFWNTFVVALFFLFFVINTVFGVFAPIVVFLLVPFSSAIAILAAEHLNKNHTEPLGEHVQAGIKKHSQRLLAFGFICMGIAIILGFVERFILGEMGIDLTQYDIQNLPPMSVRLKAAAVGFVVFIPLYLAMFFACALILFKGVSAGKALEISFTTALLCWRPILSYFLILLILVAIPVALFTLIYSLTAKVAAIQSLLSLLGTIAFIILLLIVTAVNMILAYVSYSDVFGSTQKSQDNNGDDQVQSEF